MTGVQVLLPLISEWFLDKREHFVAFAEADSRIEGWLKGELIVLFHRLVADRVLEKFEREANVASLQGRGRKQVDFRLQIRGEEHLCELKAVCISQASTRRHLGFYFRDDRVWSRVGLIGDLKKLDEIAKPNSWLLSFVYPRPDSTEWREAVTALPSALKHWAPVTSPDDFPSWIYIALWKG